MVDIFSFFSGFLAHTLGVKVEEASTAGPGLAFVAFPQAAARMPWSNFWAVLFFLMLLTLGLDSEVSNIYNI